MRTTTELSGPCQVGSETENPCPRRAVVEIRSIPFCEACAHEQEAYFAMGEMTWEAQYLGDERLVGVPGGMRGEGTKV